MSFFNMSCKRDIYIYIYFYCLFQENAMKLLFMGGWETGHLNDALARVIVEMIKREWPQQWPTLLAELSDACSQGHLHTQIVLHVFLRLVEDVATLQVSFIFCIYNMNTN